MLDAVTWAICAILFIAALTRSTVGFGDALVAMPLMAFLIDVKVAAPLMALISITTGAWIVLQDWREVRLANALPLIVPGAVGLPIGILFLKNADPQLARAMLAVMIMAFCVFNLARPRRIEFKTNRAGPVFGFLAGLLGGAFNTQGPPIVIYGMLRRWPPAEFRATAQGFFLPTTMLLLALYATAGFWKQEILVYYVCAMPLVALAIVIGRQFNQRIPHEQFARIICVFLLMVAALLLVRAIRGG